MRSILTWIDHDPEAREKTLQALSLIKEPESRDELGLAGIRNSIADQLFPGTSTVQTRLRYMLFVPWIYKKLEARKLRDDRFAAGADTAERKLINSLKKNCGSEPGIIGRRTGINLKRLASSIYWSGLGVWGIRRINKSRHNYYQEIGEIYTLRKEQGTKQIESIDKKQGLELTSNHEFDTWHPDLPECPSDFPDSINFDLTQKESEFLLNRIQLCQRTDFLLAHLARLAEQKNSKKPMPWNYTAFNDLANHPECKKLKPEIKTLLDHAYNFSVVMFGATLVYNLAIAKKKKEKELQQEFEEKLQDWLSQIDGNIKRIQDWSLSEFWTNTEFSKRYISCPTKNFVKEWVDRIKHKDISGDNYKAAIEFVEKREYEVKDHRSILKCGYQIEQWDRQSNLNPIDYRWPTARRYLLDLSNGFSSGV